MSPRGEPRYARRVDTNQADIVEAFESVGAKVMVIGKPVDLLIEVDGTLALVEVKRPGREKSYTEAQRKTRMEWTFHTVSLAVEAQELVFAIRGASPDSFTPRD